MVSISALLIIHCIIVIFSTIFVSGNLNLPSKSIGKINNLHKPLAVTRKRHEVGIVAQYGDDRPQTRYVPQQQKVKIQSLVSCGVLFGSMLWRIYSKTFELSGSGLVAFLSKIAHFILLAGNAVGLALTFLDSVGNKNTLKRIILLNILRECIEFIFNLTQFLFTSIPREYLLGKLIGNLYFMSFYFGYVRSSWMPGGGASRRRKHEEGERGSRLNEFQSPSSGFRF